MAKIIMIQGTMSNVGKSILTAGLCRIFWQDGYRTAPFKSQNMALNSFITSEGLEIGRAQAVQAEAANIQPSAIMNPILLKPTGDMTSQVIIRGKAVGNLSGREYFRQKQKYIPVILDCFRELEENFDIIVIEGAGSPAEINLKKNDIVNMGLADLLDAPVVLAGDIDRGGIFAQILGTLMLLEPHELQRVKGFIINKFRGDRAILQPGITMLEEKCKKTSLGVVPYMDIDIDEEDSLTQRFHSAPKSAVLDIAVIRLPHISNYTDFSRFEATEGIQVRYITTPKQIGNPDALFLPGTKNTMADLKWLREQGLETAIQQQIKQGVLLFGICGGYQMLGKELQDPEGAECGGSINGLGIFPMTTVFQKQKTRTQTHGNFGKVEGILSTLSGIEFQGYEIHMGQTTGTALPFTFRDNGTACGAQSIHCYGTYIHGLFDEKKAAQAFCNALLIQKGLSPNSITLWDRTEYRNRQYNLLAETLRQNLDMEKIYGIMERKME